MALKHAIHGRDHCPGGADPIPCWPGAWIRRRYTGETLTITSGNEVTVTYNDAGDPESSEIQGSAGNFDWRDYFDIPSTSQIEVLRAGHYTVSGKFKFVNTGFNFIAILNDGGNYAENVGTFLDIAGADVDLLGFTFTHRYVAGETLLMQMAHTSGSNQVLDLGYFEIRYDGPYTGPDSNDINDPDPVE